MKLLADPLLQNFKLIDRFISIEIVSRILQCHFLIEKAEIKFVINMEAVFWYAEREREREREREKGPSNSPSEPQPRGHTKDG